MNRRTFILSLLSTASAPLVYAAGSKSLLMSSEPLKKWTWNNLANIPVNMQEIYPCVFDGKIFVAGALQDGNKEDSVFGSLGPSATTHIFDPRQNTWATGPSLPEKRHHLGLVANSQALYGIGGFDVLGNKPWEVKGSVYFLPKSDEPILEQKWHVGPSLPQAQAESLYGTIHNNIHVVGGRAISNNKLTDTNAHWVLLEGEHWESAAPLSVAKNSGAATVLHNKLYVLGGRIDALQHKNLAALEFYDAQQDKWHEMAPLPIPTAGCACAVMHNEIYAFGGEKYTYITEADGTKGMITKTYDDIWCYDPMTDIWQTEELKMSTTRHGLGAVSIDNRIYLIGGAIKAGGTETTNLLEQLSYS